MDNSKLFCYHPRYRLLLHHTVGIEWAVKMLGDVLTTSDNRQVLVRDVAVVHCQEELLGRVLTLDEWLADAPAGLLTALPIASPEQYRPHCHRCCRRCCCGRICVRGIPVALLLTTSTGYTWRSNCWEQTLLHLLPAPMPVAQLLAHITLRQPWQYRPDPKALAWLQ